ncbi:MAG: hypothetical protein JO029_04025 [Candidatus Eremiobacteraeota bacterium]|nr:hypothetical protein [Candidatus Eremiobacteraeota bacterium]MBV8433432.1 hypothetical protein [Candidatus Eremiobacteraeota bacterium]MBV8723194.1 hypothetical protein [Candidatus Eremiobacteraeota bacterium]
MTKGLLTRLLRDTSGGAIMEYALVLALFALACSAAFLNIAQNSNTAYNAGTTGMTGVQQSPPPTVVP